MRKGAAMNPPIFFYDTLPSTNLTAKEMLLAGKREGVVVADRQSAGRGRLGRQFFSEHGIFMTAIVTPERFSVPPVMLTTAVAAAVCRAICAEGFDAKIKWVNDILLDDKKICGILAESVSDGDAILGYVVGIGVNVGVGHFPAELDGIAVSLTRGTSSEDEALKERLLHSILRHMDEALHESPASLIAYCTEKSAVIGKRVRFFGANEGHGIAVGLDAIGGLIIHGDDGEVHTLIGGEISVRTI